MAEQSNPWLARGSTDGDAYDAPYERDAASGKDVHGEANFLRAYALRSVLDAGCGTGRVGRELARRGLEVEGVDLDPGMLATAKRKAPELAWHQSDLATVDLRRTFDAAIMAGNVMIFVTPGTEGAVLANVGRHLKPGGILVAGFQVRPDGLTAERYDELAAAAGFTLLERYATWERDPWAPGGGYAVSVHRR